MKDGICSVPLKLCRKIQLETVKGRVHSGDLSVCGRITDYKYGVKRTGLNEVGTGKEPVTKYCEHD
jgi:curli biogenesis system outer membrane secretion channel CsgG